jgi:pimeloyl-ACP methyl ester carboxylesterase
MPSTDFIEAYGKKTQLTLGGEGPPLLYLHSAGGETDWLPFHELLARDFRVHLPAHPGFALSSGLEQIRDIYDMAWHYVDLLDKLGLKQVPVVGFSLGAWLACEIAILRPELISSLTLVAAAGLHVPGAPMAELFIDDLAKLRKLLFHDPNSSAVNLALPTGLDDPRILMWLRAREATARVGWNPYLHNPRLKDHLRRIRVPTQVVWGRQDQLIPLAHGEAYAAAIGGAKLHVLENCGHMVPFEKPEELAARVRAHVGAQ